MTTLHGKLETGQIGKLKTDRIGDSHFRETRNRDRESGL